MTRLSTVTVQMPSSEEWDKAISPLLRHSNKWRTGKLNEIPTVCILARYIKNVTNSVGTMRAPSEALREHACGSLVLGTQRMLETLSEDSSELVDLFNRLQELQAGLYAVEDSDAQSEPSPAERLHQDILRVAQQLGIRVD